MLDKQELENISRVNQLIMELHAWLYQNLPSISKESPHARYVCITEVPPKNLYFFREKKELMDFLKNNIITAWNHIGFEEEIY
jgi:hypothetical protein